MMYNALGRLAFHFIDNFGGKISKNSTFNLLELKTSLGMFRKQRTYNLAYTTYIIGILYVIKISYLLVYFRIDIIAYAYAWHICAFFKYKKNR